MSARVIFAMWVSRFEVLVRERTSAMLSQPRSNKKCPGLSCWVLDPNDSEILLAGALDDIEPIVCSVYTRKLELFARHSDRTVVETPGHRFDFTPTHRCSVRPWFEQVKAGVGGRSAVPVGLPTQDEFDGLFFQVHTIRVFQTIRVGRLVFRVDCYIGDERPRAHLSRRGPAATSFQSFGTPPIVHRSQVRAYDRY